MLELVVPGWRELRLAHLVLDVNGTLTFDGELLPGVHERVSALCEVLTVHLLSADTFGRLTGVASSLGVQAHRLDDHRSEIDQKAQFVRDLDADTAVAVGNGANDSAMLAAAAVGIAVLGPEGSASGTLGAADVVVGSIDIALDLLLNPRRLVATLRR